MGWYFWCVQFENEDFKKIYAIFIGNCFHLRDFTEKKVSKTPLFYLVGCLVN